MWTVAAVALAGLVAGVVPATTGAAAAAPYCGITWGSAPRSGGTGSQANLLATRTGQHDCFDRLVFEVDGPADGYAVNYGEAYTQGQGLPMSPYTAGGAVLNVVLRINAYGGPATGTHLATVLGYRTLRDVVFGGSFENHTTFAVGVRDRLPYQVLVLTGPGTHSRIVIDVAHRWEA
jgi:hypothetical protein